MWQRGCQSVKRLKNKQALLYAIADCYAADFERMQEELEKDKSLNEIQKLEKLLCALLEKYHDIGLNRIYELSQKYSGPYSCLMASVNNGWRLAKEYLRKGMEEDKVQVLRS